jgi:predicted phosphodiesterase
MSQAKHSPQEYMELRDQGLFNQEIADELGVSEASVRRGLRKGGYKPYLIPGYARRKLDAAMEAPLRIDVVKSGAGAVTADWHHPLANYDLINSFLDHAVDIGATNWLVVAGDWFNIDALSAFDFKDETNANLPREMYASNLTMERVLQVFDHVYLSWGNHDARVHKALGYKVSFAQSMRMMFADLNSELFEKISLSNLDHQFIDTPNGPYMVCHPAAYSHNPLTSTRKLASKELCHVITGHSHHTAVAHDPSGEFVCAEIGGFFDADKTKYLQRTTTFPKWQNGYGFIDAEGYLSVEGKGWSRRVGASV